MNVSAGDLVLFSETLRSNIRAETPSDTLGLTESVTSNFKIALTADTFSLVEIVGVGGVLTLSISDVLGVSDQAVARTLEVECSDLWFIWDEFLGFLSLPTGEDLTIWDSIECVKVQPLTESINFTDSTLPQIVVSTLCLDSLSVSDVTHGLRLSDTSRWVPQEESAAQWFQDAPNTHCTVADQFENLSVHPPEFGDTIGITYKRLNTETSGGNPIIRGYNTWLPKGNRKMTFTYLSEYQATWLKYFMYRNLGQPWTYVDQYNTQHSVILTNPDFELRQEGRTNYTLDLEVYVL